MPGSSTRNANARGNYAKRLSYALMTGRKNLRQTAPSTRKGALDLKSPKLLEPPKKTSKRKETKCLRSLEPVGKTRPARKIRRQSSPVSIRVAVDTTFGELPKSV